MTVNDNGNEVLRKSARVRTQTRYNLWTSEDIRFKTLAGAQTTVTTSATRINTPTSAKDFAMWHNDSDETLYIGDNNKITADGSDTFPVLPGDTIIWSGKTGNENEVYGITSSGTIAVYVAGNY